MPSAADSTDVSNGYAGIIRDSWLEFKRRFPEYEAIVV